MKILQMDPADYEKQEQTPMETTPADTLPEESPIVPEEETPEDTS